MNLGNSLEMKNRVPLTYEHLNCTSVQVGQNTQRQRERKHNITINVRGC